MVLVQNVCCSFRLLAVREAERAVASPVGVARTEVVRLVDGLELLDLLLGELDELVVVGDAGVADRLGDDVHTWAVGLEGDEDVGGLDVVLVGDLLHNRVLLVRRVVRAEGRVGGDNDTLLAAEVDDVLLGA
jgi:hypothetical protein